MATPTTTFTWSVNSMDRQLSNGAVQVVHWAVSANDGTYSAGAYGSVGLDQPEDDADLTPYADLTQAWAVEAAQAKLGGADKVAEIHAALQTQINVQRTPVSGSGVPW
jgi:hypothetical protein